MEKIKKCILCEKPIDNPEATLRMKNHFDGEYRYICESCESTIIEMSSDAQKNIYDKATTFGGDETEIKEKIEKLEIPLLSNDNFFDIVYAFLLDLHNTGIIYVSNGTTGSFLAENIFYLIKKNATIDKEYRVDGGD